MIHVSHCYLPTENLFERNYPFRYDILHRLDQKVTYNLETDNLLADNAVTDNILPSIWSTDNILPSIW